MDTYHVILYIHVLSLLVGFAAGMIETVCLVRLRAATTLETAAPWGQLAGAIEKAFPVAIVGLFVTGAYMTSDLWTWGTSWIVMSIVGLALLAVQGIVAGRRGHAIKEALMANGPGPLGSAASRLMRDRPLWTVGLTNEGIVLGIIWLMVVKPGWAGTIATLVVAYAAGVALAALATREPVTEAAPARETAA